MVETVKMISTNDIVEALSNKGMENYDEGDIITFVIGDYFSNDSAKLFPIADVLLDIDVTSLKYKPAILAIVEYLTNNGVDIDNDEIWIDTTW